MLKDLVTTPSLNVLEKRIIYSRCTGESFCQLNDNDLKIAVDQIMLRVAAICGCSLPNTDFFAKFIADEILLFVMDFGYKEYTLDEILLAFRINANAAETIPFSGICININYLAKVLDSYRNTRNLLDRKLQNKIDGYEL